MKIEFVKIEGGGNDFILVDEISRSNSAIDWLEVVPCLCRRRQGVGADGVLLLQGNSNTDFTMRIFNPDGVFRYAD